MPPVKHVHAIVLLAACLHALPVWSEKPDSPAVSPDNTFGQIEDLHARNLVLQAELQGAELNRSISEVRPPSGTLPTDSTAEPGRPVSVRSQVLAITGHGNQLQASVRLPDGRVTTLQRGGKYPGSSLTVTAMGSEGVTLSDGTLITF